MSLSQNTTRIVNYNKQLVYKIAQTQGLKFLLLLKQCGRTNCNARYF